MKKIWFPLLFFCLMGIAATAQDVNTKERVDEVMGIINEHTGPLTEIKETLSQHQAHLEERIIVLKYHAGNKEVQEASRIVVTGVEEYYNTAVKRIQEYESVWFEQTRNLIAIYTRYGELLESSGGGTNELSDFVDEHSSYLDLVANIKSDLSGVFTSLNTIKNAI